MAKNFMKIKKIQPLKKKLQNSNAATGTKVCHYKWKLHLQTWKLFQKRKLLHG